jgi:hypothetical protein
VAFGDPYHEILDYVKRAAIDLIVIGRMGVAVSRAHACGCREIPRASG